MKHDGRGVIRIDDRTDHGGQVIRASSGTIVMGLQAALEGDITFCPKCKGEFAIKTDRAGAKHNGMHYAYHGDLAECGARLLSSVSFPGDARDEDARDLADPANPSAKSAASTTSIPSSNQFDDWFILLDDETGMALANMEYAIRRADGRVEFGTSNAKGETHLLGAVCNAEVVDIFLCIS